MELDGLPEEMRSYFKPYIPALKKLLKIARFQMQQRSIWAKRRKHLLKRYLRKKKRIALKKIRLQELKRKAKQAIYENRELKRAIK